MDSKDGNKETTNGFIHIQEDNAVGSSEGCEKSSSFDKYILLRMINHLKFISNIYRFKTKKYRKIV